MNRADAKKIAAIVTNAELETMFRLAKMNIQDWTKISNVNKGMTKGTAWNILAADFNVDTEYHSLAKYNMIREFGEYLPAYLKPERKTRTIPTNIVHQEPKF